MNVLLNVYICTLRKNSVPLNAHKMHTPRTTATSQKTPTKINKNGAIAK